MTQDPAYSDAEAEETRRFGGSVDFGRTAAQYGKNRAGFPVRYFDELAARGLLKAGIDALDIGTGTGTVARNLNLRGAVVRAVDPAAAMLDEARRLDRAVGADVDYSVGRAEELPFDTDSFDLAVAGQCWHWFDRPRAAAEAFRVVKPGGVLLISHFDWIPVDGNVVAATEALILRYNPAWTMGGGSGIYPPWLADLRKGGFVDVETFSFDLDVAYSHADWRGRIQASAGVRASLDAERAATFDADLKALLEETYPDDPLAVPHRCWTTMGRKAL